MSENLNQYENKQTTDTPHRLKRFGYNQNAHMQMFEEGQGVLERTITNANVRIGIYIAIIILCFGAVVAKYLFF